MKFIDQRILKICRDLKQLEQKDNLEISPVFLKEGNYKTLEEAEKSSKVWLQYEKDDYWGGFEYHGFFKADVAVPSHFEGEKIALLAGMKETGDSLLNPQFILYINDQLVQGIDQNHTEILLDKHAKAGMTYKIGIHAYGGRIEEKSQLYLALTAIDQQIRDLRYDLEVPLEAAMCMDENDYNRQRILSVLNEAVNDVDFRVPYSESFNTSIEVASNYLKTNFYEGLCSTVDQPTVTCIGSTHIDVAWKWTLAQTREKVTRSFSTVLKLMEEYPEYKFMSSQPVLYNYYKERNPKKYEKIKEAVKSGRWEAEGAMWVEPDTNVSSGESLIRQILFGTRFFRNEFNIENEVLWLPDVFGYSSALPQILIKSGINYFMTTKISWNQFNKIPYDTFMWEGIDGTKILTHFITTQNHDCQDEEFETTYNGFFTASHVLGTWKRYQNKVINDDVLMAFGYGDGGGGPTREMLETAKRFEKGIPGTPVVKMDTVGRYFRRLEKKVKGNKLLPKWTGELYLEYHRGTYTSMARNKKYNRQCENHLMNAELFSSINLLLGKSYPLEKINKNWELVLLNQFHDILPGSSIKEVYDDSKEQYEEVKQSVERIHEDTIYALSSQINIKNQGVVVFNPMSYERNDMALFDLPEGVNTPQLYDSEGKEYPCQMVEHNGTKKGLFCARNVPSKGFKVYDTKEGSTDCYRSNGLQNNMTVSEKVLENKFFRIELDDLIQIKSLYDKINEREIIQPNETGNKIIAYQDKPPIHDNWNIDYFFEEKSWIVDAVKEVSIIEEGPVRGVLRVKRQFNHSLITQDICIYNAIDRIDFKTEVDWKEDEIMLKAVFPVDIHADEATYDIQFGNIKRPTHKNTSWDEARFEVCSHKWMDLSEDGYGVSLLNDSKYGCDIHDNTMRLTLLKSGMFPYDKADREVHQFTYALYPHKEGWRSANTHKMGYDLNFELMTKTLTVQEGQIENHFSFMSVDQDNVIIETVKKAEDDDALIIRLYEAFNRRSEVLLTTCFNIKKAYECTMMEEELSSVDVKVNTIPIEIKPYEIKTIKIWF
ncbi:alpha-mannosidase [Vallitalea okinawensis]|uniref:alpha-mannosidase n=1 Tax=Vallitalea okinawensis TaxID=2078660 RepID=UPI000CFD7EDE|nr:alpha-mannosidase [Vallitalea okinawensis]